MTSVSFRPIYVQIEDWAVNFMKTFHEILENNKECDFPKPSVNIINPVQQSLIPRKKVQPKSEVIDEIGHFEKNIENLEKKIDAEYKGPCYDQTYRILTELCCQYQQELDLIDVTGQPEKRLRRKNCLVRVDEAATRLNGKTHPGGKPCPRCSVRC